MMDNSKADRGVVDRLEAAGISPETFEQISVTKDGDEIVYRVVTRTRTVFVRTIHPSREEGVRDVLLSDIDIGLPRSRLLDGDPPLLVMERAKGRPLSVLLPIYLLPVFWRLKSDGLAAGFESLGRYHGRLHAANATDTVRVAENSTYASKTELSASIKDQLGPTIDRIEPWLGRVQDMELVCGFVHSDPTPHNIYYRSGDVELIDMDLKRTAVIKDRLAFECGIELMTNRLPYGRSSQSATLLNAYDSGYDATGDSSKTPYWGYLTLKIAHYSWILEIYLSGENTALRDRLTTLTDTKIITRRIEELIDLLETP